MTGTYPNCYPIPSDNKKTGDNGGDDDDGGGGTDSTNNNGGSKDPCGDYADDLIAALNRPNPDGTCSLSTIPAQCKSTADLIGVIKKLQHKLEFQNVKDAIVDKIIAALQANDTPCFGGSQ